MWFGHIQRRAVDAMVKKSDKIIGNDNARGEGKTKIDMGRFDKKRYKINRIHRI